MILSYDANPGRMEFSEGTGVEPPTFGLGNRFGYLFINDLRLNVANVLHPFRR